MRKNQMETSNQPPKPECCPQEGQQPESPAWISHTRRAGEAVASRKLSGLYRRFSTCWRREPFGRSADYKSAKQQIGNLRCAHAGSALGTVGRPRSAKRCETSGPGMTELHARPGVGLAHSSPRPDASLEAGEGADRLTKHPQATRCRKNDGTTLANLPAGDTRRVRRRK